MLTKLNEAKTLFPRALSQRQIFTPTYLLSALAGLLQLSSAVLSTYTAELIRLNLIYTIFIVQIYCFTAKMP